MELGALTGSPPHAGFILHVKTGAGAYRFERNELDLARYEPRRAGRRLPLSGKPMELLILLLEQRGRLVRREEIAARLWPGGASVDVEQDINAVMKRVRGVHLIIELDNPRFIETVIGKGYRFIASVEEVDREAERSATAVIPRCRLRRSDGRNSGCESERRGAAGADPVTGPATKMLPVRAGIGLLSIAGRGPSRCRGS